ncbi:hypothetical protein RDWZM_010248 [Blomia tropicalis]|uniref:Uncharacterized protein n=1 Tax=Blomia tropicalis TaxID=40697 RepID=A0A9Q0LWE9_BLOTA|nr:hypothetical protein BLOT_011237 [Blomia tropicalis]KAJ6215748.1 hypothetical protein RDWZM_010248 [Blomia tropicalis]
MEPDDHYHDYVYDIDHYENEIAYANLPSTTSMISSQQQSTMNVAAATANNHHRNYNNHHLNNHNNETNMHYPVHHCQPSPNSLTSPQSIDFISMFTDLAQSVNIYLSTEIVGHILTLIRLGVPADEIFIFFNECVKASARV